MSTETEAAPPAAPARLREIDELPSPPGWPLVGNALQFERPRMHQQVERWAREYGPYFTFRLGNEGFWGAYLRYMIVGAVVAVLNVAILAALVEWLGLDSRVGLAISLLLITPAAFILFKRWTFKVKT